MYLTPVQTPFDRKSTPASLENQTAQARGRDELVDELRRLANGPSTDFWAFWRGMTPGERMTVLKDEPQPGRR